MEYNRSPYIPSSPTFIRRNPKLHAHIETAENLMDMQEIQQQQYYIEKLREQRQRMEVFKEQFQRKDQQIKTLHQQIDFLKSNAQDETKLTRKIEKLQHQNLSILKQKEQMIMNIKHLHKELNNYKIQVQNNNEYANQRQAEFQNLNYELTRQCNISRQLKDHLDCVCQQHEWEIKQLQKQNRQAKEKIEEAKKQIEKLKKQNSNIRLQKEDCEGEVLKKKYYMEELVFQNQKLKEEVQIDKQQLNKIVGTLNSYKSVSELRQNQYATSMKFNIEKSEQKINKLMRINKSYKNKIKEHDACIKQFLVQISGLKERQTILEQQIRKKEQLIEKQRMDELNLLQTISILKKQMKEKQKVRQSRKGADMKLRNQLDRLRNQLYVLRSAEVDKMEKVFKSFQIQKKRD